MSFASPIARRPRVVVLGGGFTGAAVALALAARIRPAGAEIVVVEPRPRVGPGLAYSTPDPAHRLNVPAARMTAVAGDPGHFARWLEETGAALDPAALTAEGEVYPRRQVFGDYVAAQVAPLLAAGALRHLRARALAVTREEGAWRVATDRGMPLRAEAVVLAMSHPAPRPPAPLAGLVGSPLLVADPCAEAALAGVGITDRVLVVGAGLTSADVVASLAARGFRGEVTVISRGGLRSRGRQAPGPASEADFASDPAVTARALLGRIREAIARDAARGVGWRGAIDRAREQGAEIWAALPQPERARAVRRLRRLWDAHRYRLAPQVEAAMAAEAAAGRLVHLAGRLVGAEATPDGSVVRWRPRGGGAPQAGRFDRVVVTTGPDHAEALRGNPALASLAAAGWLAPDPLGLGLRTTALCRAAGPGGNPAPDLYVAGPLARGEVGELMGAPEVARHAALVAERVAGSLKAAEAPAFPGLAGSIAH